MDAGAVIGSMRRLLGRLGGGWWVTLLAVTAGTNLLDFSTVPPPGERPDAAFAVAAVIRVVLVFWIAYAVTRRMAGVARPARLTLGFIVYLLASLALAAWPAVLLAALKPWTASAAEPVRAALLLAAQFACGLALLRLLAWQQSLAIGDGLGFARGWRGLAGAWPGLAAGLLAILPVAALHLALTLAALGAGDGARVAIAVVDGAVSSVQLALVAALGVTAWGIARDRR